MQTSTLHPPMTESLRVAARLWEQVEHLTTEACILRKQAREAEASQLLGEALPPLLREWALVSGLEASARKERMRLLIQQTQKSVDAAFLQRRLIVDELLQRIDRKTEPEQRAHVQKRSVKAAIFGLKRRVPISDVCGMIDAINESIFVQECEDLLPMRAMLLRN